MALAAHMHARAFRASRQRPSAPRTRHHKLSVMAFKETQPIHDWRTQKMLDVAHTYYHTVWSKPDAKAAISQVIDDGIVFRDNVWRAAPMVGSRAFSEHVADMRRQYPDMYYEVEEFGLQDPTHLFVLWRCHETQLESKQGPASLHSSIFSGVDILAFNHERTKVTEVSQFRQPNWEERKEHEPKHDSSPYEIKLARLHVTPMHE